MKSILFGCIGIVLLVGAIVWGISIRRFIKSSESVPGVVTGLISGSSHPLVQFKTKHGQTIEQGQNGLLFSYHVGQKVEIRYLPENPQKCAINTFWSLWGFTILILILGLAFASAAFCIHKTLLF